jgi:hypothetical protein
VVYCTITYLALLSGIHNSVPHSMDPDSNRSFRKSFRETGRRVKGIFKPSSANPPSHTAPPTQTLPTTTAISPPVGSPSHTPLEITPSVSQRGVGALAQPLRATDAASPSFANVPPSSNPPPPAAGALQTAKGGGIAAWTGLENVLRALKEGSDVFPPLKTAVSGFLECLDVLKVGDWHYSSYQSALP